MSLTSLLSTPRPRPGLACARCSACPAERVLQKLFQNLRVAFPHGRVPGLEPGRPARVRRLPCPHGAGKAQPARQKARQHADGHNAAVVCPQACAGRPSFHCFGCHTAKHLPYFSLASRCKAAREAASLRCLCPRAWPGPIRPRPASRRTSCPPPAECRPGFPRPGGMAAFPGNSWPLCVWPDKAKVRPGGGQLLQLAGLVVYDENRLVRRPARPEAAPGKACPRPSFSWRCGSCRPTR